MENLTYEEFIQNILDTRGRFFCGEEYYERHHILPKCMGGGDEKENLIDLYAREHFEAHRLLALENPNENGLVYAWWMMAHVNSDNQERYELTAEEYEKLRKAYSIAMSGEKNPMYGLTGDKNPFYGKHHTEESKKKMSEAAMGRVFSDETRKKISEAIKGENHPMYGRCHSEESRNKMSEALKKKFANSEKNRPMLGKHHTEETRKKISKANKGKLISEEIRKKISETNKGENNPMACKVIQYDKQNNLIRIWDYINKAANELEIKEPSISMCCSGKYKTAGGFVWYYLYDQTRKDGTIIPGAITLGLITEEDALRILEEQKETSS